MTFLDSSGALEILGFSASRRFSSKSSAPHGFSLLELSTAFNSAFRCFALLAFGLMRALLFLETVSLLSAPLRSAVLCVSLSPSSLLFSSFLPSLRLVLVLACCSYRCPYNLLPP